LDLAGDFKGELIGGAVAQLFQLGARSGEHVRLALQDRGKGADELRTVGAGEAAGAGDVELGAAQPGAGVAQREDPVQRRDRRSQATQVRAEVLHIGGGAA
jgi:hypothetical protein